MAEFIAPNETIEGNAIDVVARKIMPTLAVWRSDVEKTMFGYYTDYNSTAVVIKTHEHLENEKTEIKNNTKNYHRLVGDTLKCDKLKIFSDSLRPVRITHNEGESHRHGANYASFTCYTIATITTPLKNLEKAISLFAPNIPQISNQ